MSMLKEIYTTASEINTGSLLEVAEASRRLVSEWGERDYEVEIYVRKLLLDAGRQHEVGSAPWPKKEVQ